METEMSKSREEGAEIVNHLEGRALDAEAAERLLGLIVLEGDIHAEAGSQDRHWVVGHNGYGPPEPIPLPCYSTDGRWVFRVAQALGVSGWKIVMTRELFRWRVTVGHPTRASDYECAEYVAPEPGVALLRAALLALLAAEK
jgi:hypothetical protein